MAQILNNMNTAVLQLPLGFIRVLELPMAILAFATTSGYDAHGSVKLPETCKPGSYAIDFDYPFNMEGRLLPGSFCDESMKTNQQTLFFEGFTSQSKFFVFTGVIAFLYCLGILAIYLFMWPNYENDSRYPMADFIVTAVIGLFWFAGSCAWAGGVSGLKSITSRDSIAKAISKTPPCDGDQSKCTVDDAWNYASLNVSLIAGFACCALWIANLWFIYKETAWFKSRLSSQNSTEQQQQQQQQTGHMTTSGQPAYR